MRLSIVIVEVLVFLAVTSASVALLSAIERMRTLRRRLGGLRTSSAQSGPAVIQRQIAPNRFFAWVQSSTSISDGEQRQKLRTELALAGFSHPAAPIWFVILRFSLAIGLPLTFLFFRPLLPTFLSGGGFAFWALALCGAGFVAPSFFVRRRAAQRRTQLEFEFPDALDLMVVCVESGLSIDAAFVRVGEEVRNSHPRIALEFGRVFEEINAGRRRADALHAMAARTDVPAIKSFVALVVQTEALGMSIAQTLRIYSGELRETRFLKAEEKAMRIPVLITVPLVACILPVIVTAVLLPAGIDIVRVLLPALTVHHGGAP
ncbi:MAG TPA: type II secretion system F family protein [Rhizomicrobium sp.]|nr:type II secretion system F family protein [Rhizomicrobium sp.]